MHTQIFFSAAARKKRRCGIKNDITLGNTLV